MVDPDRVKDVKQRWIETRVKASWSCDVNHRRQDWTCAIGYAAEVATNVNH